MSDDQDPIRPTDDAAPRVSRRDALRVLGAVPLAGALGASALLGQQATAPQQPRQTHEAPNQPAHGPGAPAQSRPLNHFFTRAEHRMAGVLADDIIPADARSPSATAVGVLAFIDFHLSAPETTNETR
ncbi:MAG: hypothetical protein H0W68_11295, partial [Gemmatimonadaceae bacterium]|nr:hypothetical protein [Gemmatimonadaceae bacterium]